jgi:ABC-type polysaccharide/polyol phosphate export permease
LVCLPEKRDQRHAEALDAARRRGTRRLSRVTALAEPSVARPAGSAGTQLVRLLRWRHLVADLARAELKRENARLVLGGLWWVADPLLQMAIYTLLVSVVFARTLPDYPLFILAALIPWKGLAASVGSGCTAITGNERIVRQIAFPRIVLPVARLMAQLWRLGIALVVMIVLIALIWPDRLSPALIWLPVLALVEVILLAPFVILLSAATVFVRDLANLMRHVMRFALYLSPVLYATEDLVRRLPEPVGVAYALNPIAILLEAYRDVAYHGVDPSVISLLVPVGTGLLLLVPALAWFGRSESRIGKAL